MARNFNEERRGIKKMSKSTDTHNVQLTNLEIFVLEFILEDFDVELELSYKDGKKNIFT